MAILEQNSFIRRFLEQQRIKRQQRKQIQTQSKPIDNNQYREQEVHYYYEAE